MNRERSLELLFSRLTWPSPLARDAACHEIARLLADNTVGEAVRAYFMKWLRSRRHESICGIALLVLIRAKAVAGDNCPIPSADVREAIPYPSLQSRLLLDDYELNNANQPTFSSLHSKTADAAFMINPFFEPHIEAFWAPWFDKLSNTLERCGYSGFRRQWAYEWHAVLAREAIPLSTEPLRYWLGGVNDARVPACDPPLSEVYRSSFLRALAWAVEVKSLPETDAHAIAAQTIPVDLDSWSVRPQQRPAWWPYTQETEGSLETASSDLWCAVRELWTRQQAGDAPWGKDWYLLEASGRVQHSKTIYDLSIRSAFQIRFDSDTTNPEEVLEWASEITAPNLSSSTLLHHYRGHIPKCSPREFERDFGGSSLVPTAALASGEAGTISRLLWWRNSRGIWAPMPYLFQGSIEVNCQSDYILYSGAGEPIAHWWDWTDGLEETLPEDLEPATGQALLIRRDLIERFSTVTKATFCWFAQLTGHYQEYGYGKYTTFSSEQAFGMTNILLPK